MRQTFSTPPRRRTTDDERILPLINIVFLLLIFFMVSGQITASDPFVVKPPESQTDAVAGERELVIHLGVDGQLALDGAQVSETEFEILLSKRLNFGKPETVWLKSDGQADTDQLISLMETMRDSGVEDLKLLTTRRGAS